MIEVLPLILRHFAPMEGVFGTGVVTTEAEDTVATPFWSLL